MRKKNLPTTSAATSPEKVLYLDEPLLEFGESQFAVDPRDGLALFGPYSSGKPSHPISPAYMLIGAPEGVAAMQSWSRAMNQAHAAPKTKNTTLLKLHRLWPPYPGFEAAFGSKWSEQPAAAYSLEREKLLEASRRKDPHERCYAVVEQFMDAIEKSRKHDTKIAVAICVVPDEVWKNCRPESRIVNPSDAGISASEKESRKRGQLDLFEEFDLEQYQFSPDFRRQLKARTMKYDLPVQLIRESTLRLSDENPFGERALTRLSDRMWNLGTAFYYKAGGKPWKLHSAREGVCYIGIAFRRADKTSNTACCAAQMFLDSGDGIVFLGEYGPWYSPEKKQFHLDQSAATKLLDGILKTYSELDGKPLTEVFLHCRSSISREEFTGFQEACPSNCKLVGIRVKADRLGPRLYRTGYMPVVRGTLLRSGDRSGFLYTSGFKPRIGTYDGSDTPVPLRIDIQHGDSDIEQVSRDILGLTKLNYNACKLGESQPVTVGFSDAVGEILIANPTITERRPNFKFYI